MKTTLLLVTAWLIILISGCATNNRGTRRGLDVISNIPDTTFTIEHKSGKRMEEKGGLVRTFHFPSSDRSPMRITARTPGGQVATQVVEWTPRGWISMAGGGLGFATVFGVGGLVSAGVDGLTGAYSDPKLDEVEFKFDPRLEYTQKAPTQCQPSPSQQCPPVVRNVAPMQQPQQYQYAQPPVCVHNNVPVQPQYRQHVQPPSAQVSPQPTCTCIQCQKRKQIQRQLCDDPWLRSTTWYVE